MNKNARKAVFHGNRSVYGAEMDLRLPGCRDPVTVAQDVYGEAEECMQVLVYPAGVDQETEAAASIRFNADGGIAEVVVPDGVPVGRWGDPRASAWLERRDGP